MSEETKGFTVRDRRHFTPEGTARQPAAEPGAPGVPGGAPRPGPPESVEERGAAAVDFAGFLLSLGTQAGMLLEGDADRPPDLAGARRMISILEMLEQKTEGRRTPQEQQVLEALLYELRMGYLERARAGGR